MNYKKPKCFGSQDLIRDKKINMKIPCTPKELGGKEKECKYKKECGRKTLEGM